jgi:hypothetical protein
MPRIGKPTQSLQLTTMKNKKKRRKKISLFASNEAEYYRSLHKIIDAIYEQAAESSWTWHRLSIESNVSYNTVFNLGERITRWPQFRTIFKLCRAVGWDLVLSKKIVALKTVA